jgi:hypothetical protein
MYKTYYQQGKPNILIKQTLHPLILAGITDHDEGAKQSYKNN